MWQYPRPEFCAAGINPLSEVFAATVYVRPVGHAVNVILVVVAAAAVVLVVVVVVAVVVVVVVQVVVPCTLQKRSWRLHVGYAMLTVVGEAEGTPSKAPTGAQRPRDV